jgi:hypothetical protein
MEVDIEALCIADIFEAHTYHWYKNTRMIGNAAVMQSELWTSRRGSFEKDRNDLYDISKMIRDNKKVEALSYIENVLTEEAKQQVLPEVYEFLRK